MEFGIFSNVQRPDRTTADAWSHDLREIVAADRVGFTECWISEHHFPAELMIAQASQRTDRIRLGPAVRALPFYNPIMVCAEANATDQLSGGRYMFGAGTGFLYGAVSRYPMMNIDPALAHAMMWESLDFIEALWGASGPIDFNGRFWTARQATPRVKPVQQPHPPVALAVHADLGTATEAARRGYWVLMSHAAGAPLVHRVGEIYEAQNPALGRAALRVARFVYLAESVARAKADLRETMAPAIAREVSYSPHLYEHALPASGQVEDVDFDWLIDSGHYIIGDPDSVHARLSSFYEDSGGFGSLMFLMGREYGTSEGHERSMELFMQEVAPRLRGLAPAAAGGKLTHASAAD